MRSLCILMSSIFLLFCIWIESLQTIAPNRLPVVEKPASTKRCRTRRGGEGRKRGARGVIYERSSISHLDQHFNRWTRKRKLCTTISGWSLDKHDTPSPFWEPPPHVLLMCLRVPLFYFVPLNMRLVFNMKPMRRGTGSVRICYLHILQTLQIIADWSILKAIAYVLAQARGRRGWSCCSARGRKSRGGEWHELLHEEVSLPCTTMYIKLPYTDLDLYRLIDFLDGVASNEWVTQVTITTYTVRCRMRYLSEFISSVCLTRCRVSNFLILFQILC